MTQYYENLTEDLLSCQTSEHSFPLAELVQASIICCLTFLFLFLYLYYVFYTTDECIAGLSLMNW